MPEGARDVHKLRAIGGVFVVILPHAFMLVDFYSLGLRIILALLYALNEQVSIASTIGPAHLLVLSLIPSATRCTRYFNRSSSSLSLVRLQHSVQ